jgi:hypothetical protein
MWGDGMKPTVIYPGRYLKRDFFLMLACGAMFGILFFWGYSS